MNYLGWKLDAPTSPINNTSNEKLLPCQTACDDCEVCLKVNRDYLKCFRECDRCRYCKFRNQNYYQDVDPPYWNRFPELPNPLLQDYALSKFTTTNVCGPVMYQEYINQYNKYVNCNKCKEKGLCWSQNSGDCVKCNAQSISCEASFGCPSSRGTSGGTSGAPKNPLYTECIPCWKNQRNLK